MYVPVNNVWYCFVYTKKTTFEHLRLSYSMCLAIDFTISIVLGISSTLTL